MNTSYLNRGEGRIAYEVLGDGPLVVLLHGMGVDRSVYRFTAPALVDAGFRVVAMDSRGHGESDATFSAYDDPALASDALALVDHLGGGPVLLVGNSMGSAAAVIAAAERGSHDTPTDGSTRAAVAGLVLTAPFVRDPAGSALQSLLLQLLLLRPWGPAAWRSYHRSLYPTRKPSDFDEYERRTGANLRRHWRAFLQTTRSSHAAAHDRLPAVDTPTLVVMGTRDRDWADPTAEARFVVETVGRGQGGQGSGHGELLLVDGAGHYPMTEFPEVVNPRVVAFAQRVLLRG